MGFFNELLITIFGAECGICHVSANEDGQWVAVIRRLGNKMLIKCNVTGYIHYKYLGTYKDNKRDGYGYEFRKEKYSMEEYEALLDEQLEKVKKTGFYSKKNADKEKKEFLKSWKYNEIYKGEFKDDLRHGNGAITYRLTKSKYEGQWFKGKRQGKGKLTYADGTVYEGDFKNDQFHGFGKLTSPQKDVFEGKFKNGDPCGEIKVTYANGDIYQGIFSTDEQLGKGTLTTKNGSTYEGNWTDIGNATDVTCTNKDGTVEHGKIVDFIFTTTDSTTYSTKYKNGNIYSGDTTMTSLGPVPNGKGKLIFANGDVYEGDFLCDNLHGKGSYFWKNGDRYKGDYKSNCQTGVGTLTLVDGTVYQGEFLNGEPHGRGKLTTKDKIVYEGEFVHGEYRNTSTATEPVIVRVRPTK